MLPIHQPKSRRIIAGILLLNYTLMSCYGNPNPTIEPSKEATKVPVLAIHQEPRLEDSEIQELPIIPYAETVMQGNFEEESTQAVQLRPIQTDSERSQLTVPLVSKETTPTPVQPAADNRHKVVKQTGQPIVKLPSRTQLPSMIIYPSSQSTEQVHGKGKQQRMQQLESIQPLTDQERQELHASIVQTLQNPIWKRYVLNKEINTTYLLPDTQLQLSPMRGEYQLARVQERLQPLVPMLSLQTREKHHIILVQDMGYWWGIIQDKRPGLSRNVALPVLYPNHADREELSQHTVEALMQMPVAVQQQLVHVFSRDRSLKNGFVYTGEEMGLVGGGRCCKKTNAVKKHNQGMTKLEKTDKSNTQEEKEASDGLKKIETFMRAKKTDQVSGKETHTVAEGEAKAKGFVTDFGKAAKSSQLYKTLPGMLSTFDEHKKDNQSNIDYLDKEFGTPYVKNPKYAPHIPSKSKAYYDTCLKKREAHRSDLQNFEETVIKPAIVEAKKQAEADFQSKQTSLGDLAKNKVTQVNNLLHGIAAAQTQGDPQDAINKIQDSIKDWETFKEDVKLFPDIQQKIDKQIQAAKTSLAEVTRTAAIIGWAQQGTPDEVANKKNALQDMAQTPNPTTIQDPKKRADAIQKRNTQVATAIKSGSCGALELAITEKGLSVQESCDMFGNTPLHKAVMANQIDVVKLLLKYGAKATIKNEKTKKTPLDLAKPDIKQLLEANK